MSKLLSGLCRLGPGLLLCFALVGCASPEEAYRKTNTALDTWLGKSEDQLRAQFGEPSEIDSEETGRAFFYDKSQVTTIPASAQTTVNTDYGGSAVVTGPLVTATGSSRARITTVYEPAKKTLVQDYLMFFIDDRKHEIVSWGWTKDGISGDSRVWEAQRNTFAAKDRDAKKSVQASSRANY